MSIYGRVYLVGAGPGDPDLLTVKALRLIRSADVIVHDCLLSPEILDLIPSGVTRVNAGKSPGHHRIPQGEINYLLHSLSCSGKMVVRLKGGDPNIFGRGGEEADFLEAHGIPCEIVPGITAAAGCSAAARIPLTYRGVASGVRFVTGHRHDNGTLDLNWRSLADPDTTLAVYMGGSTLKLFRDELLKAGMARETPVVLISNGTTPKQTVLRVTLETLPDRALDNNLTSPVLSIIGRVAGMSRARENARIEDDVTFLNSTNLIEKEAESVSGYLFEI